MLPFLFDLTTSILVFDTYPGSSQIDQAPRSHFYFVLCFREPLMTCCPVCGETLDVSDKLNNMIHLTLCFDEGTGKQVMAGGFLTDQQASYG